MTRQRAVTVRERSHRDAITPISDRVRLTLKQGDIQELHVQADHGRVLLSVHDDGYEPLIQGSLTIEEAVAFAAALKHAATNAGHER